MNRSAAIILVLALAIFALRFVAIDVATPVMDRYDESVYYSSAERMAEGQQPYRDFLLVHPPGLTLFSELGIRAGLLLPNLRILYALSGLILGGIVFLIASRAPNCAPYMPALAVLFLFSSRLFFFFTRAVMTDLPATILVAAAVLIIMGGRRGYIPLAAMMMVASSLFKLPGLLFTPLVLPLIAVTEGEKKKAIVACMWFVVWVIVFAAVCHGTLQMVWPRYFENVVKIHQLRPRTDLAARVQLVEKNLANLPFALGLLSSTLMLSRPQPQSRAIGALALSGVVLSAMVFKTALSWYFLIVLPYMAVCAATVISDLAMSYSGGVTALLAAVLVCAVQMPEHKRTITQKPRDAAADAELVIAIRSLPGRTVLTANPGYALLGRKRLPANYYSCDPYAATVLGQFNKMIADSLNEADCIIVDLRMINHIDLENVDRIVHSGKPLYCDGPEIRSRWEAMSRSTAQPPHAQDGETQVDRRLGQ
jgi:hypothetical protein